MFVQTKISHEKKETGNPSAHSVNTQRIWGFQCISPFSSVFIFCLVIRSLQNTVAPWHSAWSYSHLNCFLLHCRVLMDTKVPLENQDNLALLYVYVIYHYICQRHAPTSMNLCVITGVD